MSPAEIRYEDILKDDDSLKVFMKKMIQFNQGFCDGLASQAEFTIKLEVRGNKGRLVHARYYSDDLERP